MAHLLQDNITALEDAVLSDLGKPRLETSVSELISLINACVYATENLQEWTKPEKPEVEAWRSSWDTTVYKVPKGLALVIGYTSSGSGLTHPKQRLTYSLQAMELPLHIDAGSVRGSHRLRLHLRGERF